ncbi:MAG: hypothetical protein V1899_07860 [Planctomycetota bacterium]
MVSRLMLFITLLVMSLVSTGFSADDKTADALAAGGIDLIVKGNSEKGKNLLFKALAYDADCPLALHELGKLFEIEGNRIAAAQFLSRAVVELGKRQKIDIAFASKKMDADRRLRQLNPYAGNFITLLEEYAQDLTNISKKIPDSLTAEEASQRISALHMADILPKEKLPQIQKPIASKSSSPSESSSSSANSRVTGVTPEIERALKRSGWTTIKGDWKKISENVYEVTNGSLEAAKTNGGVQVIMHNSNKGTLSVLVRNSPSHNDSPRIVGGLGRRSEKSVLGYGIVTNSSNNEAQIYSPGNNWFVGTGNNNNYYPSFAHACPLGPGKNQFAVTVKDLEKSTTLEIWMNGKREKLTSYKIARDGHFIIQIEGTLTIESPLAMG